MDILTVAQAVLRDAGYETRSLPGGGRPVASFEDDTVLGFLHVFSDAQSLVREWEQVELATLASNAAGLRGAGEKAWNVYSVFLTAESGGALASSIAQVEENLSRTRKIARDSIHSHEDLVEALLSLLPLTLRASLHDEDVERRLRRRLDDIPQEALSAFFSAAEPTDVAHIVIEAK